MVLFINPVGTDIELFILEGTTIIEHGVIPRGDDFSQFPEEIVSITQKYELREIWCIVGPGAFTRMRIVTLALSTLAMSKNIVLKSCHFFDIIGLGTPVIKANDREYIIRTSPGSTGMFDMSDMSKLAKGDYVGYGEKNDFTDGQNFIEYTYNFTEISSVFASKEREEKLSPIYLKDPHITWSKKNTSHS